MTPEAFVRAPIAAELSMAIVIVISIGTTCGILLFGTLFHRFILLIFYKIHLFLHIFIEILDSTSPENANQKRIVAAFQISIRQKARA